MTMDSNAAAGLLDEILAGNMTTAVGMCPECRAREPMSAAHVFQGAGLVLRCPHCEHALVTIVRAERRAWIGFPGAVTMEVALA